MLKQLYKTDEITIYEQSPTSRTISVDGKLHYLKFPYLVFILRKDEFFGKRFHVFASNISIENEKNPIVSDLPLPNIYRKGFVCLELKVYSNIFECINSFWSSEFRITLVEENRWDYRETINWRSGTIDPLNIEWQNPVRLKDLFKVWKYNEYMKTIY